MKKLIIALLAILPSAVFAQNDFFDRFENIDGIDGVVVTDNMLEILGYIKISGAGDETTLADEVKALDKVKVFVTKEDKHINEMRSSVADYIKKNPMEGLVKVKNESGTITVYIKQAGETSVIKEFLMFTEDAEKHEAILISFTGNLDLGEEKTAGK